MAKLNWTVLLGAADITNRVVSFSVTQGRNTYLDNYAGGTLQLTLYNSGQFVETNVGYGNKITIYSGSPGDGYYLAFWVQQIDFHDEIYGISTATIQCQDWLGRVGRLNADSVSLSAAPTAAQFNAFTSLYGGPIPSATFGYSYTSAGESRASASTYSGSPVNYLNYLVATERGQLFINNNTLIFLTRSAFGVTPGTYTLGYTTSSTQVAYSALTRTQNGQNFINQATIQPAGLANQTATDTSSVTNFGAASYSSSTVDETTTQGLGNAQWIVANFGSPYSYRYELTMDDATQQAAALTGWMKQISGQTVGVGYGITNLVINVGGSPTTVPCAVEGWSANVTPDKTTFTYRLSSLAYYQYFRLDSTTLGILDTSRLGW